MRPSRQCRCAVLSELLPGWARAPPPNVSFACRARSGSHCSSISGDQKRLAAASPHRRGRCTRHHGQSGGLARSPLHRSCGMTGIARSALTSPGAPPWNCHVGVLPASPAMGARVGEVSDSRLVITLRPSEEERSPPRRHHSPPPRRVRPGLRCRRAYGAARAAASWTYELEAVRRSQLRRSDPL